MTAGENKFLRVYYGRMKEHLAKLSASAAVQTQTQGMT